MIQDILPFFMFPTGSHGTEQEDNEKYIFCNNTRTHMGGRSRLPLLAELFTDHSVSDPRGNSDFSLIYLFLL